MRLGGWLVSATIVLALGGVAQAADPATPDAAALEARLKALEKRVTELEQRLHAAEAAAAARPAAPVAGDLEAPPPMNAPSQAPSAAPIHTAAQERWRSSSAWAQLHRGMTWSQVQDILGRPGSKTIGVFGDVWFYPDSSGGRVVFDRDSRVSGWTEPPGN